MFSRKFAKGLGVSFLVFALATVAMMFVYGWPAEVASWTLAFSWLAYIIFTEALLVSLASRPQRSRLKAAGLALLLGFSPWLAVLTPFWWNSSIWSWVYSLAIPGFLIMNLTAIVAIIIILVRRRTD